MKSVRLNGVLATLLLVLLAACSEEAATGDPAAAVGGGGVGGAGGAVVANGGSGGVTTSGQGGACGMVEPLSITYYDVNHVLSTGQSLSIGVAGTPALSTAQPLDNTMFEGGLDTVDASDLANASFVPLIEGTSPQQETMSSGLANLVGLMARDEVLICQPAGEQRHDIFVSVHGRSSTRYAGLKKGTEVYNNGLAQVTAAYELAQDNGQSYTVRAVTTVHGESDHTAGIMVYAANLVEWQSDLQADIQAITSQTEPVPMFQSQISNWARLGGATSVIPSAQLAASEANPEAIIVVGPKYALPYATDGVHLTNHGYRQM
ncbi:MAG: hypothetical protein VB934_11755 [Polyangiaceae bacterium]